MMKKLFKKEFLLIISAFVGAFLLGAFVLTLIFNLAGVKEFLTSVENRTFDIRQSIMVSGASKKADENIIIVAIDDPSYEYVLSNYGEWPLPRGVYADLINYLEKSSPRAIAFDLMFVNSMKSKPQDDFALTKAIKNNKNVYVSMNFDNQPEDLRKPVLLPENLSVGIENNSRAVNFESLMFSNCRAILPDILNGTENVGLVNVLRSSDGVLRKIPPLVGYQDRFYPQLSLLVALDYFGISQDNYKIDNRANLHVGNIKIPLDSDGSAILNWYGKAGQTFKQVSLYKLINAQKTGESIPGIDFKNKIIYFGTTTVSLYDTKTVPIDKLYPGVEIHTTFLNNILDGNFIKKVSNVVGISISLALAFFVGAIVMISASTLLSLAAMISVGIIYVVISYYLLFANLWLPVLMPILATVLVYIFALVAKYLLKSRDFDYQYKLATTDGLTELYNHRFFQDRMKLQIEHSSRYEIPFSLIIVDIDFFKKFNDKFGHQSGDAVLRQVAKILKINVRASDIVCRYGGEEMSIILPSADKDEARLTAQKLCNLVSEKPFKLSGNQKGNVTISLGVSTFPQDGKTPQELIEVADKGLYAAKENGRNQVGN